MEELRITHVDRVKPLGVDAMRRAAHGMACAALDHEPFEPERRTTNLNRHIRMELARKVQTDYDLKSLPFYNRHTERKFWKTEYRSLKRNREITI